MNSSRNTSNNYKSTSKPKYSLSKQLNKKNTNTHSINNKKKIEQQQELDNDFQFFDGTDINKQLKNSQKNTNNQPQTSSKTQNLPQMLPGNQSDIPSLKNLTKSSNWIQQNPSIKQNASESNIQIAYNQQGKHFKARKNRKIKSEIVDAQNLEDFRQNSQQHLVYNQQDINHKNQLNNYQNQKQFQSKVNFQIDGLKKKPKKTFIPNKLKDVPRSIKQLVPVEQISSDNYLQSAQSSSQIATNLIKFIEGQPQKLIQYIPVQIIHKLKNILSTCEDKVNLQEIILAQVKAKNHQLSNSNPSVKSPIELSKAHCLTEQANCLFDTGKYLEAIKTYEESAIILQKNFNEECSSINGSNQSIFGKAKNWFLSLSNPQNHLSPEEKQFKIQQSKKNIHKTFKNLADSLLSLTKCYENVTKSSKRQNLLMKSSKIINEYQKIINSKELLSEKNKNIELLNKKAQFFNLVTPNDQEILKNQLKDRQNVISTLQQLTKTEKQPSKRINSFRNLRKIRQIKFQNGIEYSSELFEKLENDQRNLISRQPSFKKEKSFDYTAYGNSIKELKKNYEEEIKFSLENNTNNFQVLKTRNQYARFLLSANQFTESVKQSREVLSNSISKLHTVGGQALLNIGKVSLARGSCKKAFQNLNKSYEILKKALLKINNSDQYRQVLLKSPIYREIELTRVKVYNIQMRHDLAIKTLEFITPKNITKDLKYQYLASIEEEKGNTLALNKPESPEQFIKCFINAIQIRQKLNNSCLENGLAYCTIIKYLIRNENSIREHQNKIKDYLQKANSIFAKQPKQHPSSWPLWLIYAKLSEYNDDAIKKNVSRFKEISNGDSDKYIKKAVNLVRQKHGKDHINTLRVRLQECFVCKRDVRVQKIQCLKTDIQECISKERQQIKQQNKQKELLINDQKKVLLEYLQKLQKKAYNLSQISQRTQKQFIKKNLQDYIPSQQNDNTKMMDSGHRNNSNQQQQCRTNEKQLMRIGKRDYMNESGLTSIQMKQIQPNQISLANSQMDLFVRNEERDMDERVDE